VQIYEAAVAMSSRTQSTNPEDGKKGHLPSVRLPDAQPIIKATIGRGRTLRLVMLAYHAEFTRASMRPTPPKMYYPRSIRKCEFTANKQITHNLLNHEFEFKFLFFIVIMM